jgi:hypothetical protein
MPKRSVSAWRLLPQNLILRRSGFAGQSPQFLAKFREITSDQSLPEVMTSICIAEYKFPQLGVESSGHAAKRG